MLVHPGWTLVDFRNGTRRYLFGNGHWLFLQQEKSSAGIGDAVLRWIKRWAMLLGSAPD